MGIDFKVLRFLVHSRGKGVSFDSVLMVGRQRYWEFASLNIADALRSAGIALDGNAQLATPDGYAEPLLRVLGANRIESIDYSDYEGATILQDLNLPVRNDLRGAFSCVFDAGTIEHVFHFPQAIKNCMQMVARGGSFLTVTNANNFMGHGFYQFSPELFYRVFSEQNGFVVEEMLLSEIDQPGWYLVADPAELGRRVELVNSRPTCLMMRARKLREVEIFAVAPQQSDYVTTWSSKIAVTPTVVVPARAKRSRVGSLLRKLVPEFTKRPLRGLLRPPQQVGAFDSDAFTRIYSAPLEGSVRPHSVCSE
jgi:hypothetical protein